MVAGQALPQPVIDDIEKSQIGLTAVHDASAGIDVGLRRIGLDQALTEAMDGRAGHFVDRCVRSFEIVSLSLRQTIRQSHAQLGDYIADQEFFDNFADARQQLARGQFGEGDSGDGVRRNAVGKHDGYASGHDGGLA